mgnify:FL=1
MLLRNLCFALCAVGLVACGTSTGQDTPAAAPKTQPFSPELYKSKGFKELTYKASGKPYPLFAQQKAKGNLGLDKVLTYVSKGKAFTATTADDTEVQNMVRDAYRALNLCPENLHPGLVNFGYGPFMAGDVPMWNIYLKCTDKLQSNV